MYSEKERQQTLDLIISILKEEPNIEGALLVGSGATGFADKWSDIDLSIVVSPDAYAKQVWKTLNEKIKNSLDITKLHENEYGSDNYISVILLKNFLEIDMGVISLSNLVAKRPQWKILFEKSDLIEDKMTRSWVSRRLPNITEEIELSLDSIWYHIKNAAFNIKREKQYRVIKELEEIRDEIVRIKAIEENMISKHYRDVDQMEESFKEKLKGTFFPDIDIQSLQKSFVNLFELYFEVIKQNCERYEEHISFEKRMRDFLHDLGFYCSDI